MSPFANSVARLAKSLEARSESIFSHNGNKGTNREDLVIEFLLKVFPHRYGFAKGEIFDAEGGLSGQVDIIIYDRLELPVFSDGTLILAPVESTYGAIEVKSRLTTSELEDIIQKVEKYRGLKRPVDGDGVFRINPRVALNVGGGLEIKETSGQPLYGAFCFENEVAEETLLHRLSVSNVDLLVIVGRGIYLKLSRHQYIAVHDAHSDAWFRTSYAVAAFVLFMQHSLSKVKLIDSNRLPAFLTFPDLEFLRVTGS